MIDWNLYPNFSREEFECQCGCGRADMQPEFLEKLQAVRTEVGFSITVSSGFRCPDHNNSVSSTGLDGPHTTGWAADLAVDRGKAHDVLSKAMAHGFTGIGVQQKGGGRFLHLDGLTEPAHAPRPTVWSY